VKEGDEIYMLGEKTGVVQIKVENILNEDKKVYSATKGDKVTFKCSEIVRPKDAVYLIRNVPVKTSKQTTT
jgi:hypothetical protein